MSSFVAAVTSTELPADLKAEAKRYASVKVVRFLDGMSLPAFVAGLTALSRVPELDPERCALLTVSGWDPSFRQPELADGVTADFAAVASHYCSSGSPTAWLRTMVNSALCHIAIAAGVRGPNIHLVGRAPAVETGFFLAEGLLGGDVDHVLIVAFDAPHGEEGEDDTHGAAAAIVLSAGTSPNAARGLQGSDEANPDERAVDALDAIATSAQIVEVADAS